VTQPGAPAVDVDPVFVGAGGDVARWWDEIQHVQAEFGYRQEVAALYGEPTWLAARSVVDVGTGNGWWLSRLQQLFPDKAYVGLDVSATLIERAAERHPPITFVATDHAAAPRVLGQRFDFLTARLFMQHVTDVDGALTAFAQLVRPGGGALIVDSHDAARLFSPDVPRFREFFDAYRALQARGGRDRAVGDRLERALQRRHDWSVGRAGRVTLPSTVGDNLQHFRSYYRLMLRIVEATGVMAWDFPSVVAEWEAWCADDRAYTQLALDVLVLRRSPADEPSVA
jgi:ubiquinone/menaquinone biosynthesis C-methylase UbiE